MASAVRRSPGAEGDGGAELRDGGSDEPRGAPGSFAVDRLAAVTFVDQDR
jgi:hypothetical protein